MKVPGFPCAGLAGLCLALTGLYTQGAEESAGPEELVFAGDSRYPPFEWRGEGGPVGFNIDLENAIVEAGGARARHRLDDWPVVIRALARGEVDVVPMFRSPGRAERFLFSEPFYSVDHALYADAEAPSVASIDEIGGQSVAVEASSYAHGLLQQRHPQLELVVTANTLEALVSAAIDEADYALVAVPTASHLIRERDIPLRRIGPPFWSRPYAFAVRKDRSDLAAWLTRNLETVIQEGRYEAIYADWKSQLEPSGDMPALVRYGLVALIALTVAGVLGLLWVWSLKRNVARRTALLRDELRMRRVAESRTRYLFNYDHETNLPRLDHFLRLVNSRLEDRERGKELKLVAIELLGQQRLSLTFGHEVARRNLLEFVDFLKRKEFLALGQVSRSTFVALTDGEGWRDLFRDEDSTAGELRPLMAIGVARANREDSAEAMLRRAETALAVAVSRRNAWVVYSPDLEARQEDLEILNEFRKRGVSELYCVFQPQVDLRSGRIVGGEALVRWQSSAFGAMPPDRFIPLLEDAGLIGLVTCYVIDEVVNVVKRLQAAELPSRISINISQRDFHGLNIPLYIRDRCGDEARVMEGLTLEITETSLSISPDVIVANTLNELQSMGVDTSIDDFGTGYSSLYYLSEYPIREVKIDRMFVRDFLDHPRHHSIVRSTITLAHELDMVVVAEGVETQRELKALRELGCDLAQGYHFARPLKEEAFIDFATRCSDPNGVRLSSGGGARG